nr:hypothetical protein [Sphingomonas liriopis]
MPLHHSWPLWDLAQRFDLGCVHDRAGSTLAHPSPACGAWAYDLVEHRLDWSPEVYRLFGFKPQDGAPTRAATLARYAEPSRAAMERLRAHAIRHRRGFTLDIQVTPIRSRPRWLRLTAAPVEEDGVVVRLHGWKADVTHLYARSY